MRDDEGEDEDGEEGERQDEHVEEAVVPPPDAVSHPGTVMVEALCGGREREKKTSNNTQAIVIPKTPQEK